MLINILLLTLRTGLAYYVPKIISNQYDRKNIVKLIFVVWLAFTIPMLICTQNVLTLLRSKI